MEGAHIHLLLNHFPIIGTFIGTVILAYSLYAKNITITKVGLVVIALMAIIALPAYFSGEEAEEAIEHFKGISKHVIHEHEELAEKGIVLMALLGILALASLYAIKKELAFTKKLVLITLIVSIVTFGLFAKVGNLGGQIRHSEIRDAQTQNQVLEHDDDDDD